MARTMLHEALGHYVQAEIDRGAPTTMQKVALSPLFVEGWAGYVEEMMLAEGWLPGDAKVRVAAARASVLRAARLVAAVRLHALGAKIDDATKVFTDEAGLDDVPARREAERAAIDPMVLADALGRIAILQAARRLARGARRRAARRLPRRAVAPRHAVADLLAQGAPARRYGQPAVVRALVLVAALGCGCAAASARVRVISSGGAHWITRDREPWRQWHSDHVTLDSDVSEPAAEALLVEFERSIAAFDALFLPDVERPRGRLHIAMFARRSDYFEVGPLHSGGYAMLYEPDGEPTSQIDFPVGTTQAETLRIFQHELTHHYVNNAMPQSPTWLNEGLAELWGSLHADERGTDLGYAPPPFSDHDLTALLGGNHASFHAEERQQHSYLLAGAFTEYLWFQKHEPFLRYLHALVAGAPADAAWSKELAGSHADDFERWYSTVQYAARYRNRMGVERSAFVAPRPLPPLESRMLSWSEVARMCAALHARRGGIVASERAASWAATALLVDPFDSSAYYWAAVFAWLRANDTASEAGFATALALRPDDSRALAGLIRQRLWQRPRVEDLSQIEPLAAGISPRTSLVMPLRALAAFAFAGGRSDEAVAHLRRAVTMSPACVACRLELANLYNARGETAAADAELERALARDRETTRAGAADLRSRLVAARAMRTSCDGGDAAACEKLAEAFNVGLGMPLDPAVSRELMRRACDGGRATACRIVARDLRSGRGQPADPAASVQLLTRACKAGDWESCNDLGDSYENGAGTAVDLVRAVTFYRNACAHDSAMGCVSLASLAWRGLELAHEEPRIVEWLSRAVAIRKTILYDLAGTCPQSADGCALLSLAYSHGLGGSPPNRAYAAELMTLACEHGDAAACRAR